MIPKKWITFDLIQDSVRKSEQNTETELKSFSVHEAVGKAENYCSDIVRVSSIFTTAGAVATEQRRSFIVKSSIETTEYDSLNEEVSYLPKEIKIYDQILPAVAQLLLSIDDDTQIAPKCFATGESHYLILEDLMCDEFVTIDRRFGLDYEHLKLTISSLAKWHATTAHLYSVNKQLFASHTVSHHSSESVTVERVFTNIGHAISILSGTWTGFEEISAKFGNISHESFLRQYPHYIPSDDKFTVLCHGDMWINNFLYKYDANRHPIDIRLVDFALCLLISPEYDLCMLLYGSSNVEVTPDDWDTLLEYYHSELSSTLTQLKYPKQIPTLAEIHAMIQTVSLHGILVTLFIIGLRNMETTHENIFLKFVETSEESQQARIELFSNGNCIKQLKSLLKFLDRHERLNCF